MCIRDSLKDNAALAGLDQATLYGGGATGYVDYPTQEKAA